MPTAALYKASNKKSHPIRVDNENLRCHISFCNWLTFLCNGLVRAVNCGPIVQIEAINGYELNGVQMQT